MGTGEYKSLVSYYTSNFKLLIVLFKTFPYQRDGNLFLKQGHMETILCGREIYLDMSKDYFSMGYMPNTKGMNRNLHCAIYGSERQ